MHEVGLLVSQAALSEVYELDAQVGEMRLIIAGFKSDPAQERSLSESSGLLFERQKRALRFSCKCTDVGKTNFKDIRDIVSGAVAR